MKKLKFVFWLVFVGFFALLVYQNLDFFSAKNSLQINLGIYQRTTPELTNGAIIAAFVGIAVFVMLIYYFSSRYSVYKSNKTVKELKKTLDERTSTLAGLKEEMASLKQGALPAGESSAGLEEPENMAEETEAQVPQSPQV